MSHVSHAETKKRHPKKRLFDEDENNTSKNHQDYRKYNSKELLNKLRYNDDLDPEEFIH